MKKIIFMLLMLCSVPCLAQLPKNGAMETLKLDNLVYRTFDVDLDTTIVVDTTWADSISTVLKVALDTIAGKVSHYIYNALERRVILTESGIEILKESLALTVSKTEVDTMRDRINIYGSNILMLNNSITSTVSRAKYSLDSTRIDSVSTIIKQTADSIRLMATVTYLHATLGGYVTTSALTSALGNYVTVNNLGITLGSYVTTTTLANFNYITSATLGSYYTKTDADGRYYSNSATIQTYINSDLTSGIKINADKVNITGQVVINAINGNSGSTTIDGGKITTGTVTLSHLNFTPAKSDNVVGMINASTEGIQISGAKIKIDGTVTFGTGYNPSTKTSSSDVTTIIGNTVNTAYINALNVTANTLVANASLTTPVINGALKIGGAAGATLTFNQSLIQFSTGISTPYDVGAGTVSVDGTISTNGDVVAQGGISGSSFNAGSGDFTTTGDFKKNGAALITAGTTLAHYGITDAVATSNFTWANLSGHPTVNTGNYPVSTGEYVPYELDPQWYNFQNSQERIEQEAAWTAKANAFSGYSGTIEVNSGADVLQLTFSNGILTSVVII
jgi:hypothetical protein